MGAVGGLKVDRGVMRRLAEVAGAAREVERLGYDGCWTAEISHDPFLPLTLAAEHTTTVELGTSIAVAFARNPMTVANIGWDLQEYSRGRLLLGLGTQIKPHIEKRFSMPWSQPARRMREFVLALHAIWDCWHNGTKLGFEGEFYTHRLMTPMFVPEPQPYGTPKILVAAVGELMTEMCGEVTDGVIAHAFTTKRYFDEVTIPALQRGLAKAGRTRADVEVLARCSWSPEPTRPRWPRRRRHPQADRVLRLDAGVPQGVGAARLGRAADRTAPAFARRPVGRHGRPRRRRDPRPSPSSRRSADWRTRCGDAATASSTG